MKHVSEREKDKDKNTSNEKVNRKDTRGRKQKGEKRN